MYRVGVCPEGTGGGNFRVYNVRGDNVRDGLFKGIMSGGIMSYIQLNTMSREFGASGRTQRIEKENVFKILLPDSLPKHNC